MERYVGVIALVKQRNACDKLLPIVCLAGPISSANAHRRLWDKSTSRHTVKKQHCSICKLKADGLLTNFSFSLFSLLPNAMAL